MFPARLTLITTRAKRMGNQGRRGTFAFGAGNANGFFTGVGGKPQVTRGSYFNARFHGGLNAGPVQADSGRPDKQVKPFQAGPGQRPRDQPVIFTQLCNKSPFRWGFANQGQFQASGKTDLRYSRAACPSLPRPRIPILRPVRSAFLTSYLPCYPTEEYSTEKRPVPESSDFRTAPASPPGPARSLCQFPPREQSPRHDHTSHR